MPILVSPTYTVTIDRRFHVDVAFTVIKLPDGSYANTEGYKADDARWAGALAIYRGGYENVVDTTEAAALTAAGYTVV